MLISKCPTVLFFIQNPILLLNSRLSKVSSVRKITWLRSYHVTGHLRLAYGHIIIQVYVIKDENEALGTLLTFWPWFNIQTYVRFCFFFCKYSGTLKLQYISYLLSFKVKWYYRTYTHRLYTMSHIIVFWIRTAYGPKMENYFRPVLSI